MVAVLTTLNPKDEIFTKSFMAPPIKKKKDEEKVIEVDADLMQGLPVKKPDKRLKRAKLQILKESKGKQKAIRKEMMRK